MSPEEVKIQRTRHFDDDFQLYGNKWEEGERAKWLGFYLKLRQRGTKHLNAIMNTHKVRRAHRQAANIRKCVERIFSNQTQTLSRFDFMDCRIHGSDLPETIDFLARFGLHLARIDAGGNPTWGIEKIDGQAKQLLQQLNTGLLS